MKKLLILMIFAAGILFPLACSDNNSNKASGPTLPGGSGSGPTSTSTPAVGFTPGSTPGTATPIPTFAIATPVFVSDWPAASAPTGCYLNGSELFVTENDGVLAFMQTFTTTSVANGAPITGGNNIIVLQGPATMTVVGPQAIVMMPSNSCGFYTALLDSNNSGGASIFDWQGQFYWQPGSQPVSAQGNSWGSLNLNKPKALASDGNYFYIADTGNAYVDEYNPCEIGTPAPIHRWKGNGINNFVKPTAIACGPAGGPVAGNVFVGDAGYNPSLIQEYASGGVSFINQWSTIPNCVINWITVDINGNMYVSDIGNSKVEEYSPTGTLLRDWGDPQSSHEFQPFVPSCIALTGTNILVGDSNNDLIQVFGP